MRKLFTTAEARKIGITPSELRWGESVGRWRRIERGVYGEGTDDPSPLDRALAAVVATGGVAEGHLAGVLLGLDSVDLRGPYVSVPPGRSAERAGVRRRDLPPDRVVLARGIRCTDGLQTMLDLAVSLNDLAWEQALESALRKRLLTVDELAVAATGPGAPRIRRVLALRPGGAPPTESLLETLTVQLARTIPGVGDLVRQLPVYDEYGQLIARVDLAWPELGVFIELDGEHHKGQPLYDAVRQTAVAAATGWLCGRFTWTEVVRFPKSTARRLAALLQPRRPAKYFL